MLRKVYWSCSHRADWRFSRGDSVGWWQSRTRSQSYEPWCFHFFHLIILLFYVVSIPSEVPKSSYKSSSRVRKTEGSQLSSCWGRHSQDRKYEGARGCARDNCDICWEMLSYWLSLLNRTFPRARWEDGATARKEKKILQLKVPFLPDRLVSAKASPK